MFIKRIAAATGLSFCFFTGAASVYFLHPGTPGASSSTPGGLGSPGPRSAEFEKALEGLRQHLRSVNDFRNAVDIHTIHIIDGIEDARRRPSIRLPDLYGLDIG